MNVIVSNVNSAKFNSLDVDVIKSINGEFSVDEIVRSFSNFFFNRMFLDITAIKNYRNVSVLKELSKEIDGSKIILLLTDDRVINSDGYISSLVDFGIYNFTQNEGELKQLYDNPRTFSDVSKFQQVNNVDVVNETKKNEEEKTEPKKVDNPKKVVNNVSKVINKTNNNVNTIVVKEAPVARNSARIIGFRNLTNHAGATSLIYMLKKQLSVNYYAVAIEINKRDFMFYKDKDMISCKVNEIRDVIRDYQDADVILIDLNDAVSDFSDSICEDVILLMESSTLMINRLVMLNRRTFEKNRDKMIVLNQSMLSSDDVKTLQREADIQFFDVLPSMDDRVDNSRFLFPFLEKLGLYKRV